MKTDSLIAALVADLSPTTLPIARTLTVCAVAGAGLAALIFFAMIGLRPDIAVAATTLRFQFKVYFTIVLLIPALALTWRLSVPGARPSMWLWALLIAPGALAVACVVELLTVPPTDWAAKLVGSNARACLTIIPLLALAPLVALLVGLSSGASTEPTLASASAGLASGALAAMLYATNCTDDSPLFVAVWYTIAIAGVMIAAVLVGSYVLRW